MHKNLRNEARSAEEARAYISVLENSLQSRVQGQAGHGSEHVARKTDTNKQSKVDVERLEKEKAALLDYIQVC